MPIGPILKDFKFQGMFVKVSVKESFTGFRSTVAE